MRNYRSEYGTKKRRDRHNPLNTFAHQRKLEQQSAKTEVTKDHFFLKHSELLDEQERIIFGIDEMFKKISYLKKHDLIIQFFADEDGNLAYTQQEKKELGFNHTQSIDSNAADQDKEKSEQDVQEEDFYEVAEVPKDLTQITAAEFTLRAEHVRSKATEKAQYYHSMLDHLDTLDQTGLYVIRYFVTTQGVYSYDIQDKKPLGF